MLGANLGLILYREVAVMKNDIETVISDTGNERINRISKWISEASGRVIKSVDKHEIDVSKYEPLRVLHIYHYQKN